MNETINKFLLAREKSISEMQLRQHEFTYSACGPFTKNQRKNTKILKKEFQDIFIKTNWIKLAFLWNFKYLPKSTGSDKVLCDKAFNIAKNPKYNGYHHGLASMVYNFLKKKSSGGGFKNEIMLKK